MPSFNEKEGKYFVRYVTGLSHVKLGLCFSPNNGTPALVNSNVIGNCSHEALDKNKIFNGVMEGIAEANQKFKKSLQVSEIIYVENDTPRYELYRYCAYLLAKRVIELSN